ncbi:high mobility group protein 20A [Microplitis demolitor]|uniref:high mobility group protein 20A n=1 Tax=Microplitis demolitor TaxID=69319 RepID=UPI0004CDCC72|nr:high mobility group protein 20A [Microplitis demolitor]
MAQSNSRRSDATTSSSGVETGEINNMNGDESAISTSMTTTTTTTTTSGHQSSGNNINGESDDFPGNRSPYSENAEEKVADSAGDGKKLGLNTSVNSNNATPAKSKSKKRKKTPRDATAPKQPLTGYFRFLNDRRDKVRNENPNMSFADITKFLAAEWSSLPGEQKQQYLIAAEQDKERYNREYSDYKQTEAYRLFSEKQSMDKQNDKKVTDGTTNPDPIENLSEKDNDGFSGFDIPIFTEEFLDHNKACESELRQLRKATSDCESQNAVLQRHVDSLHAAVNRLESETNQQRTTNQSLQRHLDTLRNQLASCFSSVPLKGTHEGANLQNIDSYIERLEYLLSGGGMNSEPSFRNSVQNAIAQFDLIG